MEAQKKNGRLRNGLSEFLQPVSLGIFVGIAFLVVPELIGAIKLLGQSVVTFLDTLARAEENADLSQMPYGTYLSQIDIDWIGLKNQLEQWLSNQSGMIVDQVMSAVSSAAGGLVTAFIGLVFSIYALARKESLKGQICRLIRTWLPQKFGNALIHVSSVCNTTFHEFIVGQVTEAVILGTLCTVGMLILRIPYAPMIGALVGITTLIPYVGSGRRHNRWQFIRPPWNAAGRSHRIGGIFFAERSDDDARKSRS
mgnify:FL=1